MSLASTRIQLCGRLVVALDGERVENRLPGRQGRLLLAYLALNRNRTVTRTDLVDALWADGRDGGLAPLLSKLRRVVSLDGLRLALPPAAMIDVEAAAEAVHRAESAIAQGDPHRAWAPSQVALFVASRRLLPGDEAAFLDETRGWLEEIRTRALEAYGQAGLGIGGSELASAVRAGRELAARELYRESGYRLLMEALAAQGNPAEALLVYEQLRVRLRSDLGVSPCAQTQQLHLRILTAPAP